MKKIFAYIVTTALFATILPSVALADLQCFEPPYTGTPVNVQNVAACKAFNPQAKLYDTSTQTWSDPTTGTPIYNPSFTCVGLGPAYRTANPTADGACNPGYKLGHITRDAQGNVSRVDYADGTAQDAQGGNITAPSAPTSAPSAGANTLFYTPLEPLPGGTPNTYNSTGAYFALVYKIFLAIGAMVAVVSVVFAGITYMVSEAIDKKSEARRRLNAAAIGGLILLGSWIILNTINPNLVRFDLSLTGQNVPAGTASGSRTAPTTYQSVTVTDAQIQACKAQGKTIHYDDTAVTCR